MYREVLRAARIHIVRGPLPEEAALHQGIVAHPADVPIVVAAMQAQVDHLVTLNRRYFSTILPSLPVPACGWALRARPCNGSEPAWQMKLRPVTMCLWRKA